MRSTKIKPVFVDSAPDQLEDGVLYVSEKYRTAIHKCCCGCGEEVVTPLSPVEWCLQKEGATVSLHPSIGNWDYKCKSHYLIVRNQVIWAAPLSERGIEMARTRDKAHKKAYIAISNSQKSWHGRLWSLLARLFQMFRP